MDTKKPKRDLYSIDTSDTCYEGAGYPAQDIKELRESYSPELRAAMDKAERQWNETRKKLGIKA